MLCFGEAFKLKWVKTCAVAHIPQQAALFLQQVAHGVLVIPVGPAGVKNQMPVIAVAADNMADELVSKINQKIDEQHNIPKNERGQESSQLEISGPIDEQKTILHDQKSSQLSQKEQIVHNVKMLEESLINTQQIKVVTAGSFKTQRIPSKI